MKVSGKILADVHHELKYNKTGIKNYRNRQICRKIFKKKEVLTRNKRDTKGTRLLNILSVNDPRFVTVPTEYGLKTEI